MSVSSPLSHLVATIPKPGCILIPESRGYCWIRGSLITFCSFLWPIFSFITSVLHGNDSIIKFSLFQSCFALFCPICVYASVLGISLTRMGQYYTSYTRMGVPYEYACMIVHSYIYYMHSRHHNKKTST